MFIEYTPELIAGIVGIGISWLFGWFPGLRTWYAALKTEMKSVIMLSSLALSSVIVFLLVYYDVLQTAEPLTWWRLLTVFFTASTLNQANYTIMPEPKDVKQEKAARLLED